MRNFVSDSPGSSARARGTLLLLACFYVVAGFAMAVSAAIDGNPVGTFLGFLIVTGSIAIAVAYNTLLHLADSANSTQQSLDNILQRMGHPREKAPSASKGTGAIFEPSQECLLDLSAVGPGDPSLLVAVRLERDVFPRLASALHFPPPASPESNAERPASQSSPVPAANETMLPEFIAQESIPQETALQETMLRRAFAAKVRQQDFAAALAVGEQIRSVLPDSDIAQEYREIKPLLCRRLQQPPSAHASRRASHS